MALVEAGAFPPPGARNDVEGAVVVQVTDVRSLAPELVAQLDALEGAEVLRPRAVERRKPCEDEQSGRRGYFHGPGDSPHVRVEVGMTDARSDRRRRNRPARPGASGDVNACAGWSHGRHARGKRVLLERGLLEAVRAAGAADASGRCPSGLPGAADTESRRPPPLVDDPHRAACVALQVGHPVHQGGGLSSNRLTVRPRLSGAINVGCSVLHRVCVGAPVDEAQSRRSHGAIAVPCQNVPGRADLCPRS